MMKPLYAQVDMIGKPNYVMLPTEDAEALGLSFPTTICAQVRVPLTDNNWDKLAAAGYQILGRGAA